MWAVHDDDLAVLVVKVAAHDEEARVVHEDVGEGDEEAGEDRYDGDVEEVGVEPLIS